MSASSRIFSGEYRHGIDPKNRVTIPSQWRLEGGEAFKLRVDSTNSCLMVFTNEEFLKQIESATQLSSPRERQEFIRMFAGLAMESSADKQGRMVLPVELTKQVGLEGEVIMVGTVNRFEIWSPEKWEARKAAAATVYSNLANQLGL